MPDRVAQLRFGDFDNDGRTDVLAIHATTTYHFDISWGGVSPWRPLATTAANIADLAVGDFDGDHYADIFWANGTEWKYAPGGGTQWTHLSWSSQRTPDLRFGDFTGDAKTDVFMVLGNQWGIVRGGTGTGAFEILRPALTFDTTGLVAADFDGDGFADIGRLSGSSWQSSARGTGAFVTTGNASSSTPLTSLPVGRFDGDARADVLFWQSLHLGIASHAGSATSTWSQQDMK